MKTEVILHRPFGESSVRQMSKCGFICATDITEIYNVTRPKEGKEPKQMQDFFELKDTCEFLSELCNELNGNKLSKHGDYHVSSNANCDSVLEESESWTPDMLKFVKRGKENAGTWFHPALFIAYAMWLSPKFKAKVVIWVSDHLLYFRNQSGDAFRECNRVLDLKFNIGNKYWEYARVADFVSERVFGLPVQDRWNEATEEELRKRDRLLQEIVSASKYGSFVSVGHLLGAITQ